MIIIIFYKYVPSQTPLHLRIKHNSVPNIFLTIRYIFPYKLQIFADRDTIFRIIRYIPIIRIRNIRILLYISASHLIYTVSIIFFLVLYNPSNILQDLSLFSYSSITHSTDTFYGIICSGLTDKTRLSFTSSNSSFTECVKINNKMSSFHKYNNDHIPECTIDDEAPTAPECTISGRNSLSHNHKYHFKFCTFSNLNAASNNGGAIYLPEGAYQSSTSLEVSDSIF